MILTIGHSTHSQQDFAALLRAAGIHTVVDTRSHPGSRWPQYQREAMEQWLPAEGFGYAWAPQLGGWLPEHAPLAEEMLAHGVDIRPYLGRKFPKQRIALNDPWCEGGGPRWTNTGLRDYSFFMSTPGFLRAASELIAEWALTEKRCALLCCECQWWRCHRSMISDHLAWRGLDTHHVMPVVRQKNLQKYVAGAKLLSHADQCLGDRLQRYEEPVMRAWNQTRQ